MEKVILGVVWLALSVTGASSVWAASGPVGGGILHAGLRGVYGFDIAVDEGDKELSQQVWRGDAHNATDTSHFGTIVLADETVTR